MNKPNLRKRVAAAPETKSGRRDDGAKDSLRAGYFTESDKPAKLSYNANEPEKGSPIVEITHKSK